MASTIHIPSIVVLSVGVPLVEFNLEYNCGPVSLKFHEDRTSRVKLLIGPFGTGKTSSAGFDLIEVASKCVRKVNGVRRSRFAVVRNTYPELRDTTIASYFEWFPPGVFGSYNVSDKKYKMVIEDREIEIIFKALDSPQDVRDLLSLELTGAHVDEAREIHHDVIKGLLGRVGRFPSMKDMPKDDDGNRMDPFLTPPQIALTTNYPSTEHWLYKDFVEQRIDGYAMFEQNQEENAHNLRKNYYEDLEKDYANRPDLLKTLVRGEWGVTVRGKAVYKNFVRGFHVSNVPLLPTIPVKIVRGWDNTGLSPAIVLTYINNVGQWCIFKEFCFEDEGIMDATEVMILWCNEFLPIGCTFTDIADPAGAYRDSTKQSPADYIRQVAKQYSVSIRLYDGIQTFKVRREAVDNRLVRVVNGQPAVIIDPSCTRIIDGFDGGYAYPEIGNSGVFKLEPAKNLYSHIADAVQYIATRVFAGFNVDSSGNLKEEYFDEDEDIIREESHATGSGGY